MNQIWRELVCYFRGHKKFFLGLQGGMDGWRFGATCMRCGADLSRRAS